MFEKKMTIRYIKHKYTPVLPKIDRKTTSLQASWCQVRDISSLLGNCTLTTLDLSSNLIDDFSSLKDNRTLTYIDVSNNRIESLSFLEGNCTITHFNASHNLITNTSSLGGCEMLQSLNLDFNRITDISPLTSLTSLTLLSLNANEIVDISSLKGMTSLDVVSLKFNKIVDVSSLSALRMRSLYIDSNKITDPSPLWGNTHITSLTLGGNPMAFKKMEILLTMERYNCHNIHHRRTTLKRTAWIAYMQHTHGDFYTRSSNKS
jgi:internalin A